MGIGRFVSGWWQLCVQPRLPHDGVLLMPLLTIYIDEVAFDRLQRIAAETGRAPEDLAECAVEEAILERAKSRGWLNTGPQRSML